MISELQIGTTRLLTPIQKALRDKLEDAVIDPFTIAGQELWVQRIQVIDPPKISFSLNKQANVILRSDSVERYTLADTLAQNILVTQDVHIHLALRSGAVFSPLPERIFQVRFQVTEGLVEGSGVSLSFGLATDPITLVGPSNPDLLSFLAAQVGGQVQPINSIMPFDIFFLPFTSYKDKVADGRTVTQMTMVNTGIALSADQTFLSVRLEVLGFPNTVTPWTEFYQGRSANHLTTSGSNGFLPSANPAPWSLFVQGEAFTESIGAAIDSALKDAALFDNPAVVAPDWSAPGGASRISVVITGERTLTTVLNEDIVGSAIIRMTLDLSVPATNEIQLDAQFSVDTTIAGFDVTSMVRLLAETLLSNLIGATFAASDLLGDNSPLGALGKNIQCSVRSLSSLRCRGSVTVPSTVANLRDSIGLDRGILLMGSGQAAVVLPDPRPALELLPFSWNAAGIGCPSPEVSARAAKEPLFSVLQAVGGVSVTNTLRGSRPVVINDRRILDDPLGFYSVPPVTGSTNAYLISATCAFPPPGFKPPPLILALYTNAGIKLAKLDAPPNLSPAEVSQMVDRAIHNSIPTCEKLVSPWGATFDLEWNVDPLVDLGSESYVQIWELEVPQSPQGGTVTVHVEGNPEETQIIASAGRQLSGSFATKRGDGLRLQLRESPGPKWDVAVAHQTKQDHLGLRQTLLFKAGHLQFSSPLKGIVLEETSSRPLLTAGSRCGVNSYDMTAPSHPKKIFELSLHGLKGLANGGRGKVLVWGNFGIVAIDRRDSEFTVARIIESPVQTVCRLDGRWYVSTAEGIVVLDCNLKKERCIQRTGGYCGCLLTVERQLVWIADGEAQQLSSCGSTWTPVISEKPSLPDCFESVRVGRNTYLFAPYGRRGGSLWTLNGTQLSVQCELSEDPWFRGSARLPGLVITAGRDSRITIYSVAGESRR